jgi:anti-sigma28 factor (negative regulator of flagellin synthesis)
MEGAGEDRVEQLRLDVSAGNYHPDSAEVAKKIVEYHTGAEF